MEEGNKVYIPVGVKVSHEPFKGYSEKALGRCAIACLIASVFCFFLGLLIGEISYGMTIWIGMIMLCLLLFRENELNINIIDYVIIQYHFYRDQQEFDYEYEFDCMDSIEIEGEDEQCQ